MTRSCGTCAMCCKVMRIEELEKAAGQWCRHCKPGKDGACMAYADRPLRCVEFKCLWLDADTPQRERMMPPELRPDRCHVVVATQPDDKWALHVDPAYPDAWRRQPFIGLIHKAVHAGATCAVMIKGEIEFLVVKGDEGIRVIPKSKLEIGEPAPGSLVVHVKEKVDEPAPRRPSALEAALGRAGQA